MAHKVTFTLPERQLGNADIEVCVKRYDTAFGRLLVSKGSLVWRPANKRKGKKVGWKRLDNLMREHGSDEK